MLPSDGSGDALFCYYFCVCGNESTACLLWLCLCFKKHLLPFLSLSISILKVIGLEKNHRSLNTKGFRILFHIWKPVVEGKEGLSVQ